MSLKRICLVVATCLCTLVVSAQITDSQLIKILQGHRDKGSSQIEIMEDLEKKGVSLQRLKALEKKMRAEQEASASKGVEHSRVHTQAGEVQSDVLEDEEEADSSEVVVGEKRETVFGQSLFADKQLKFAPNLNVPIPDGYVLGPGDEVIVDMWGNSEVSERQVISPQGDVVLADVGLISLNGLTLKEATKRITIRYSKIYSDLADANGSTYLKVSLGQIRSISVSVLGEVVKPGNYTLSSLSTVFHALYVAGGVSEIGTLREIQLFRKGKLFKTMDAYSYLLKGTNENDVVLTDGDVVLVGTYDAMVSITGAVKRPLRYELKQGETVEDLLRFAGGFAEKAFTGNVQLSRSGALRYQFYTIEEREYGSFELKNGDSLVVASVLDDYENRVEVIGSVYRPGSYAVGGNVLTVKSLIEVAGGVKGDAYRERCILYREGDDLSRYSQSFSVDDVLSGAIADIALQKNDVLFVPSVRSLQDGEAVTIRGSVKYPGEYPYIREMSVADMIVQAGGFLNSAYKAKIDVYRRCLSDKANGTSVETFSFSFDEDRRGEMDGFHLEPYDEVYVYQSPWYKEQQNVVIRGEVMLPGVYAKLSEGETVSSLIERAGGFTSNAYVKGCRLVRQIDQAERVRAKALIDKVEKDKVISRDSTTSSVVGEEIATEYVIGLDFDLIMKKKGGKEDIILRKGDVLEVPIYNGLVKISGAVASESVVPYDKGNSISSYIDLAGGYSRNAARSRKYVVYMSGKTKKLRMSSHIQPGCEIVVPVRKERRSMSTGEVVGVTSSVVSLASVITTLIIALSNK